MTQEGSAGSKKARRKDTHLPQLLMGNSVGLVLPLKSQSSIEINHSFCSILLPLSAHDFEQEPNRQNQSIAVSITQRLECITYEMVKIGVAMPMRVQNAIWMGDDWSVPLGSPEEE